MYETEIKTVPETPLIYVPHTGPYIEIGIAYERLMGAMAEQGLLTGPRRMLGLFYDNPDRVPAAQLRSRAAAVADGSEQISPPLERMVIPAGPVAVLHYKGPYTGLKAAYGWLYGEWLPKSGREPGDGPEFEEYLNDPQSTPASELLTDIHLPLRA